MIAKKPASAREGPPGPWLPGPDAVIKFAQDERSIEDYNKGHKQERAAHTPSRGEKKATGDDRKRLKEKRKVRGTRARDRWRSAWNELRAQFLQRLRRGDVVATGYVEPLNLQNPRITIPPADWQFLELETWCRAAIERKSSVGLRARFTYETDDPREQPFGVHENCDSTAPRAVLAWLLFAEKEPRRNTPTSQSKFTKKDEMDVVAYINSLLGSGTNFRIKTDLMRMCETWLGKKIPGRAFERIWEQADIPDSKKRGGRPPKNPS